MHIENMQGMKFLFFWMCINQLYEPLSLAEPLGRGATGEPAGRGATGEPGAGSDGGDREGGPGENPGRGATGDAREGTRRVSPVGV